VGVIAPQMRVDTEPLLVLVDQQPLFPFDAPNLIIASTSGTQALSAGRVHVFLLRDRYCELGTSLLLAMVPRRITPQ
jgi:hypothetical protein